MYLLRTTSKHKLLSSDKLLAKLLRIQQMLTSHLIIQKELDAKTHEDIITMYSILTTGQLPVGMTRGWRVTKEKKLQV